MRNSLPSPSYVRVTTPFFSRFAKKVTKRRVGWFDDVSRLGITQVSAQMFFSIFLQAINNELYCKIGGDVQVISSRNQHDRAIDVLNWCNSWVFGDCCWIHVINVSWLGKAPDAAMILPAITAIHPLPPLQVTVQSIQKMRDWVQTSALCQTGNNDGNSWNSPFVPLSEKNLALHFSLTSRSSKKTTGNRKKRKMDNYCTIPRVMMVTTHLWNKRLIFTWEG